MKICKEFKKVGKEELIIDVAFICSQIWKIRSEVVSGKKFVEMDIAISRT